MIDYTLLGEEKRHTEREHICVHMMNFSIYIRCIYELYSVSGSENKRKNKARKSD